MSRGDGDDGRPRGSVGRRREPRRSQPTPDPAQMGTRAEDDRSAARTVEAQHADGHPRRAQSESSPDERRWHLLAPRGRVERHGPESARGRCDTPGVEHAPLGAELRLHRSRAEQHRAPVVVGRELVPRIGPRDEVRHREPEDVRRTRRLASRRGEVVRRRDLPAVEDDLSGRVEHRLRGRRLLSSHSQVDLAPHVGIEVERLSLEQARDRVRAGGDGLRLQSLGGPAERDLARRRRPAGSSRARRRSRRARSRPAGRARACRGTASRRARAAPSSPVAGRAAGWPRRVRRRMGARGRRGA